MSNKQLQQPELIAQRCDCCDVELDERYSGRHRYTWPISRRQVEICSSCQSYIDWGLQGEIAASDGTVYHYLYISQSRVLSFSRSEADQQDDQSDLFSDDEETGMYCFGLGGPGCNYVKGTKPYPHLAEISAKIIEAIPDLVEKGKNYWLWWAAEKERRGLI